MNNGTAAPTYSQQPPVLGSRQAQRLGGGGVERCTQVQGGRGGNAAVCAANPQLHAAVQAAGKMGWREARLVPPQKHIGTLTWQPRQAHGNVALGAKPLSETASTTHLHEATSEPLVGMAMASVMPSLQGRSHV